ncbi:unnamed protein product [Lymnaea stagnalis]|uniref:G-protein coupled receptors family 1 profile domain-containing protein n=1 Tax=Lymnaea stagnalis TaxID=6523 RepID=A0AAV2IFM8_LYMST
MDSSENVSSSLNTDDDYNFSVSSYLDISSTSYDDTNVEDFNLWSERLLKNYMFVFCGFGLPANILIIATISKFHSRCPASFLLCYLALIDSVALVAKLLETQIIFYHVYLGRFGCKINSMPSVTLTSVSNWTVVLISSERYIAICKPLKKRIWCTNKRCKIAVSLMSGILTVTFVIVFFIFVDINSYGFCSVIHVTLNSFHWLQFILSIAIPFILVTILTNGVIRALYYARCQRRKFFIDKRSQKRHYLAEQQNQTAVSSSERMEKLSLLMMSTVLLYFVVYLPVCVTFLVIRPLYKNNFDSLVELITNIFYVLSDSSHVLNFFLYFVFVSGFRRNVYKLLRSVC